MPLLNRMITEVVLCAALQGQPVGCLSTDHPAAALYPTPCSVPPLAAAGWREGDWRGKEICWRARADGRVAILAGAEPIVWVAPTSEQMQCLAVSCQPTINVQLRNHKGRP